ncbi:hypothetical protein FB45DRAFT_948084 [Roridomyces roridus]|uniref:RNase III domain-containing protein n=1 Tax=Roridomyces roridus TaxID=1738132 RepID=A0AAD7F7M9_9AGAR|nr:hypothetical protein FB45DRAFT_948084 [Roridomyces roridus]
MQHQKPSPFRNIVLRAIAKPDFTFHFDEIDSYWTTCATSRISCVRDTLEHVGDGRIEPFIFALLVDRWPGQPVQLLKQVCTVLVSNVVFSAILMGVGACNVKICNTAEAKVVANNLEAYVAAYARQFGTRRLKTWVFRAFGPLVDSIRAPCIAAFRQRPDAILNPNPIADIGATLANLGLNAVEDREGPLKRKSEEEDSGNAAKRARLQLGDVTNTQGWREPRPAQSQQQKKRTKHRSQASKSRPVQSSRPSASLVPVSQHRAPPPQLVSAFSFTPAQPNSSGQLAFLVPASQHRDYSPWAPLPKPHPAVAAFSFSPVQMPWWTASRLFASVMKDVGVHVPNMRK